MAAGRVEGTDRKHRLTLVAGALLAGAVAIVLPSASDSRVYAAALTVNDTADRVDTNAGNGSCQTSTGSCTLRAAIQEANALPGPDTITVPAGTYAISIPPVPIELLVDPNDGDFDITDAVTITGAGSLNTIIDAGTPPAGLAPEVHGLDRLFDVHPTAKSTTITGVTVRDGYSPDSGGAVRFGEFDPLLPPPNPGTLRLVDVSVLDNYSGAYGGGVHVIGRGRLEVTDSTLSGNGASAGGAAINNMNTGTVVVTDSVVAENPGPVVEDPTDPGGIMLADPTDFPIDNGAINNQADMGTIGTIVVRRSSFTANAAGGDGAAIHNSGDGIIAVEESDFTGNVTEATGAAIYSNGGTLTIDDSELRGNRAHDGGAVYTEGETTAAGTRPLVEITDSEFDGNHVESSGGALVSGGDGELVITGSDFTENFAPDEGGAIAGGGRSSLDVTDSRFIGNQASGSGGAVIFEGERSGSVVDTLFRENVAGVSSVDELGLPVEGDGTGGGLHTGGSGPVTIADSTFERNEAHGDGGGIGIDGSGTVRVTDTVIRENHARGEEAGGGGVENSGERVTFTRVLVTGNTATGNGGGIHNTSSNEFTVVDTTITNNKAENGGGFSNASDSTLVMRGSLIANNLARFGPRDDTGLGGGLHSIGDAGGIVENTTISGNTARVRGGGVYNDADGGLRLANVTIWRNSAPFGGGIGVMESDAVPTVPPTPLTGIIVRNTIVAGSIQGGGCDGAVKSEGGNIDTGPVCFDYLPQSSDIVPVGDRMNADPQLDALADNGGPTLTHALREGSVGIDGGVNTVTTILGTQDTCPDVDQRNLPRPVNVRCDVGAYEHQGPFPPADLLPPDTEFLRGPFQDTEETMAFEFTGRDDESAIGFTPVEELTYECRLLELDPTEPPEPVAPGEPVPPELQFRSCASPWSAPLGEEGNWVFEVVAIDRAGRKDPTPASHPFDMTNLVPPNAVILEAPVSGTSDTSATFTFTATDDLTPPQFMEYECRMDTRDPEAWLECFNPVVFSNLEVGTHTFEVRATDSQENIDPTPARHTWTIAPPTNCDEANISLTAAADGWVDEINPAENKALQSELTVNSDELPGNAARALFRFNLPIDVGGCTLESATLRLYHESSTEGRTLQALPIAAPWSEQTLTWVNQPPTTGPPASVVAGGGGGYLRWDVTAQVASAEHGFLIRDAVEVDPEGGGDQSFASRETVQDPPPLTLPQLVLRYAPGASAPLPPTPPAAPVDTVVTCGQVLTQSTRVMNDLTDCLGEGLVIGAPNIILDLNGHVIDGPDYLIENATGQEEGFPPGIRNSGHDHVTIRNGTVQQFGFGVLLTAATWNNTLENLTILRHAVAGVELNNADNGRTGNRIVDSVIRDNELGVQLLNGSEGTTITGGEISGNLGEALYLWEANRNVVENVTIHGIPTDPNLDSDGGILLESASENVFRGNTVRDTGDAGFVLSAGSDENLIEDNTMYRNGDAGVYVQDSAGNHVVGNIAHLESDGGVVLNGAPSTVIRNNDLRFNPNGVESADSDGLVLEGNDASDAQQDGFAIGNGADIVVRGNVANRTGSAGISLEGGSFAPDGTPVGPALVEGNTANENLADGISVAAGGHIVKDNNGHNNAGYGISSDELNVDGGGNRASGNGRPEQCLGVVCNLNDNVPLSTPDITPPETIDLVGPPDGHNGFGALFSFSATDNASPITAMTFECRVDAPPDPILPIEPPEPPEPGEPPDPNSPPEGEGWEECANPQFYPQFFEAGDHHFEVRASDYAHNLDLTPLRWEWTVVPTPLDEGPDTLPPSTTILEAPSDPSTASTVTFRFGGSDNRTPGPELRYECALDAVGAPTWTSCSSPHEVSGLTAGAHRFEVRSIDFADNVDASPAVHTWTYTPAGPDTTPPDTTIDSHPDSVTVLTTGTFRFSSPDPTAEFECNIDGAGWSDCTSPRTVLALDVADHTFQVRAVDPAGNEDPTPASFTWSVTAPPVATSLYCGQIVTQSVELTNDMVDCPEIGLVIGAPRITIDLGGYTIDGVGVAVGVRNRGFDDVTITNGTITGFDVGVHLEPGTSGNIVQSLTLNQNQEAAIALVDADNGATGNTLRRNVVAGNDLGIILAKGSRGTLVHDNTVGSNSGDGIRIDNSSDNTVEDNRISGSSGGGVQLVGAAGNSIVNNELSDNGIVVESGYAVQVIPSVPSEPPIVPEPADVARPSPDNLVEGNSLEGDGIEVRESNGNQLVGNDIHAAAGGIDLYNSNNGLIKQNDVSLNSGGIELLGSRNNRIEANNASENSGSGISLSALSLSNVIVGNTANVNSTGIDVSDQGGAGSGSVIEGNIASNNDGDGIQVSYPGHTITRNTANNNGNWGIYVALGASVDGGGNSASDNTQPAQCFNVRCDGQAAPPELVPPDTIVLRGPSDPSTSSSATIRFTGTDNVSLVTFQCALDLEAFAPCTSPTTLTGVTVGAHTFQVRAVDAAGNVDGSPAEYSWARVASSLPVQTSIDSGPDPVTVAATAAFTFSASEPGATFQCALTGPGQTGEFAGCNSPATYTGLAPGAYTFEVRADGDPTTASHTWTIGAAPVDSGVGCGEIVTRSVRLTNDIIECPGIAIVVGAPNITIDLNGHLVDGAGEGVGVLNPRHDGVTITNGSITGFGIGVQLNPGVADGVLSALRVESNQEAGIVLSDADDSGRSNTIRDNEIAGNMAGVHLTAGTRGALVAGNTFSSNTGDAIWIELANGNRIESNEISLSSGAAILLARASDNDIVGNTLEGNLGGGISVGEEELPSNSNLVEGNTLSTTGGFAVSVVDSDDNRIVDNVIDNSIGDAVVLELVTDTVVEGNVLQGNGGGISVAESVGNRIEANLAVGATGSGIALDTASLDNVVRLNTASSNVGDGIEIADLAPSGQGNLVGRNTTNGNGGDGIIAAASGHTITANVANFNGGFGMFAVPGNVDGGGNQATGNVEPQQCEGIACTIGEAPGAPQTILLEGPPALSNSHTAAFFYTATDDNSALVDIVFECRIDSTDPLQWEDCEYPAIFSNLAPGEHTVEIRAIDAGLLADPTPVSVTWTYTPPPAGQAPDTIIDLAPPAETPLFEALFTFRSDEPDVTYECQIDALGWQPCGQEQPPEMIIDYSFFVAEFEDFEVGPHTFRVRAIDIEGNVDPSPDTHTWSIAAGPITTIISGPADEPTFEIGEPLTGGQTNETTATFRYASDNAPDSTYECSLDFGPFVPCNTPAGGPDPSVRTVTYSNLGIGEHIFRVFATSPSLGEELEAVEYEWEILEPLTNEPPQTVIAAAPGNFTSELMFEFQGTDDFTPPGVLTFECGLDTTNPVEFVDCVSPLNILELAGPEGLAPGAHTFAVRAVDATDPDGQPDPTPATYEWTHVLDIVEPQTTISASPALRILAETPALVSFTGTDNATPAPPTDPEAVVPPFTLVFECSLDGAAFEACQSPGDYTGLEPGPHTVQVRAIDTRGNSDSTPATATWTVVGAPVTTFSATPPVSTAATSATFAWSSDQTPVTYTCTLNGWALDPCASPLTISDLWGPSTQFTLEVVATNEFGLVEEDPATFTWTVSGPADVTSPDTTITEHPLALTRNPHATFAFASTQIGSTFDCSLDGAAFNSCETPLELLELTAGAHTFRVRAVDASGNQDPTPASYTWTVDGPPVTTITGFPLEDTTSSEATFTFTSSDPGSTFECFLDGIYEACTSPKAYTGLIRGDHVFAVRATDPSGNLEVAWQEHEWTIGIGVDFTQAPADPTDSTTATFAFASTIPGATMLCSLDGAAALPCTSPKTYTNLTAGTHEFSVEVIDPQQLVDPLPILYTWTIVDVTAPQTTITDGPTNPSESASPTFTFTSNEANTTFQCRLDTAAAFTACPEPATFEGLAFGSHTLRVRAVDSAGLFDLTPDVWTWSIVADTTRPDTTIDSGPPLTNADIDAIFTFSGTDAGTPALELEFECRLDAGVYEPCDSPHDVQDLAPGTHTLRVRAIDLELNVDQTPAVYTWTVLGPTNTLAGVNVIVEAYQAEPVNGTEPPASAEVTFPVVTVSGSTTMTQLTGAPALPAGFVLGTALYYDLSTTASYLGQPMVCFEYDPATFATPQSVRLLHFTGGSWTDVSSSGDPANGEVCATVSTFSPFALAQSTAPIADQPPDTTLLVGPPALTVNFIHVIEFTGTDDWTLPLDLEFECLLDGVSLGTCSTLEQIEAPTAGEHLLQVRAIDALGQVDPTPAEKRYTIVDLNAPDTAIEVGPDSPTTERTATFEFIAEFEPPDPPGATFECALDAGDFAPCTSPYTVTIPEPAEGAHVLMVRAVDLEGNIDPTPDIYEWLIEGPPDTTAPDTIFVAGPPAVTPLFDALVTFTSNEAGVEFECSIDGGAFEGCESAVELTGLEPGSHSVNSRAIDEAGNVDLTPASHSWTISPAPSTMLTATPPNPSPGTTALFSFTSDQAGSRFECNVDAGEWTPCTSPYLVTFPDPEDLEGPHTFQVRAVNPLNPLAFDATPSTFSWHVGLPPDTTITLAETIVPDPADPALTLRLAFTGTDDFTNPIELEFECRLDSDPFETCDLPQEYDLTTLTPGPHTFDVRAVDLGGSADPTPDRHSFTVEPTPDTSILTGPDPVGDGVTATSATFTFDSDIAAATFECRLDLDPAGFAPCVSGVSYTGLALGEHLFEVRARMASGNVDQEPAEYGWLVGDDTPPTATILTGPPQAPATTTDTTVTFTFTGDAMGGTPLTFQCSLSGPVSVALQACNAATGWTNPTALIPGAYTFEVIPVTPHLLVDAEPQVWEFEVVDETDPQTTIVDGPNIGPAPDTASGPFAAFVFASSEADSTFECSFDATTWESCSITQEYSSLTPGETILSVRAVDPSGNVDETPASHTWTVFGPPETTIVPPVPAASTTDQTATFAFTSDQTGVTFECSLNGAVFVDCTSPVTYTDLAPGAYTFEVQATNGVGLTDATAATHEWAVVLPPDTTPPIAQVVTGPPATTTATQAVFTFSASEPAVTYECAVDGGSFGSCPNPLTLNDVEPGDHSLAVRATDGAGNIGPASPLWTWTVDGPADTTITSGPLDDTRDTTATFEFTANETGVTFECSFDGAAYTACTSPYEVSGLAPDSHTLLVRTVDSAGNIEPQPAEWSWDIIESEPPEATITSQPPATVEDTTATFTFLSDEPGSTFVCALDFAAYASCTSPTTYTDLGVGTHVFAVKAIDPAGNESPAATATWTIEAPDTTPPVSTIGSGPGASTIATSATFSFSSNEAGSTFNCSLDTAPFAACTSPVTVSGLALGNHTFRVRARDAAGNFENPGATYAWTVVAPPPDCGTEVTLAATGDAWLEQSAPGSNKGVDSTLKVTSKSSNQNVRTVIRFGVPATVPAGCVVESATLRMFSNSASPGSRTLRAVRLTGAFNENTVTWSNQPGSTGTPATTTSGTGWRTWNVTAQLQAAYDANQLHGFLIRDASENQGSNEQQLHSREKATERPELVLRFGPATPPPPTTTSTTTTTTTAPPTTTTTTTVPSSTTTTSTSTTTTTTTAPPTTTTTTAPPACTTSTVTVGSNQDSWVLQSAPGSTFGSDSVLKVESKSGNNSRALVRFNLPAIPAGCSVTNVQLRLWAGSGVAGRTLQAIRLNGAWTEAAVTWANQPATTGATATTPSGTGWREWSVTAQVQAMYTGANHGILIRDAAEDDGGGIQQQLHSKEKAPDNPPQLVITFGP